MNWALIGASTIASQYMIDAVRAQGGNEILHVVSSSMNHALNFADKHNFAGASTDLDDVLINGSVDAVYISSTNEKHLAQALATIRAGKHVICEKPLAMTAADAAKMLRAAADAGVVLSTNHHLRNAGSHLKIKEIIDAGQMGDVLSIRIFHAAFLPESLQGWRVNEPGAGGGVIPDIVVHDADTVRFYLDEDPKTVTAIEHSGGLGRGVEDSVMSVWKMPLLKVCIRQGVWQRPAQAFNIGAPKILRYHRTAHRQALRHAAS